MRKTHHLWGLCALLALGFDRSANADLIQAWNFAGNLGNEASDNATFVIDGLEVSSITRGPGLVAAATADSFSASSWAGPVIVDPNDYFEFAVIPDLGTVYSITTMSFNINTPDPFAGVGSFQLRSSADGFASGLDTWTDFSHTNYTHTTPDFSGTFTNLAGTTTFRLYGYNNSFGVSAIAGLKGAGNDLIINGIVVVPEPGACAVVIVAGLASLVALRRDRRRPPAG